ncbi:hypothetical protein N2152v2_001039 [Parachlorella kessleri]
MQDEHGNPTPFGETDPGDLFGPGKGWCDADEPASTCECFQDGLGGPFCETHFEQFCINQCSGRGECRHGFCKCHPGWFGQDCAYSEAANSTLTPGPGLSESRPWLAQHVHTPAAEYRWDKGTCTHRLFDEQNSTYFNDGWLYGAETALHEMLLQSEHRTLDPEEADLFYLPVYTSCFIFPVLGAADFPYFHSGPVAWRTHAAANMLIEVFHWVRAHHPYWDRKGGRDHILLVTHDEGSCWVPAMLRPAIILSYWGRTDLDHISGTGYWPDNYTADSSHPVWQPEGHDVVLPMFSSPGRFQASPFLGAAPRDRSILAFFRGRLQTDNPAFSRGTRQFLARTAAEQGWWEAHKIFITEHGEPPGFAGRNYSVLMASSVFCLALMGDGWSSRFTDAVLHGCIPVVIQDQVEMELSSLLDVSAFSLRVAQADMGRLPEILKAVPRERIQEMQAALWRVWHKYFYGSYRPFQGRVRELRQRRQQWAAVARVWAHADGWDVLPPTLRRWGEWPRVVLQQEPGRYNETAWKGFDLVLHTAAQHGIKVILTLSDYHSQFGEGQSGIEPYLQWVLGSYNLSGTTVLDFYTGERAKLLFKANMCRMATRVNSITGRAYRDDPAVLGWELINEPSTQSEVIASWAAEMSDFMKCVDPNHLVSVGLEGYFGETDSDELLKANPGAWVLCEGASWSQVAALPHIDFNTAHMYQTMRGSWDEATKTTCGFECSMRWFVPWIESHVNASSKPFVLEEFQQPFIESEKNAVFDLVRSTVRRARDRHAASAAAGKCPRLGRFFIVVYGTMFWGATVGEHVDWDGNGLYLDGSLPLPAPDDDVARARLSMPEAEKQWLAAVQDMQKSFRRQEAVSACYEDMKKRYAYLYSALDGRARTYNSTSMLRIVEGMAADAEQVENLGRVQPDGVAQG